MQSSKIRPVILFSTILITPPIGLAQVQVPVAHGTVPNAAVFRSATDLVALTITVTDSRQQPVPGLSVSDFMVLEDGVQQDVSFFAAGEVPLDITLLVDGSASMRDKLDTAREAVRGLTRRLRSGDRISVIEFRDSVVQRQGMTDDRGVVEAALNAMTAKGSTALYNAMYVALSGFKTLASAAMTTDGHVRRQTIVVLSDGYDTKSLIGYEEVLEEARRRGVTIYVIALRSGAQASQPAPGSSTSTGGVDGGYAMRSISRETGGQCFFPTTAQELAGIYQAISSELGQQYAIGYTPRNKTADGAWRRVMVRLPLRPDARPRTRAGYFAQETKRVLFTGLGTSAPR